MTLSAGLERAIGLLDPARRPKSAAVPEPRAEWVNRPYQPGPTDDTGAFATGTLFDELADPEDD